MKNSMLLLCLLAIFFSCNEIQFNKEFYSNGNIKKKTEIDKKGIPNGAYEEYYETGEVKTKGSCVNGFIEDTLSLYYKNGNLKEKGIASNNLKTGWWSFYSLKSNLEKRVEYKKLNDSTLFENQIVKYYNDGKINYNKSWFFQLNLPDTLKLGRNLGSIKYYSHVDADEKFMYIVIENEYENSIIKKDTFTDKIEFSQFGVYANKLGEMKIKGEIIEQNLLTKKINKDSSELTINTHTKYFEKNVFVINND